MTIVRALRRKFSSVTNSLGGRRRTAAALAAVTTFGVLTVVVFMMGSSSSDSSSGGKTRRARNVRDNSLGAAEGSVGGAVGSGMDPRLFTAIDASKDGFLSEGEIAWEMQKRIGKFIKRAIRDNFRKFMSLDQSRNHNGMVEWEEWFGAYQERLKKSGGGETRREKERLAAAMAAWKEAARSNPESLNIDEFLAFTHPEVSHSLRIQEADEALQNLDEDMDGLLSEKEFLRHPPVGSPATQTLTKTPEAAYRRAFKLADSDGDGVLAKSELFSLLDPTSEAWCRLRAARMVAACDSNGDGGLDKEEFSRCPTVDGIEDEENAEGAEAWPLFPEKYFHPVW